MQITGLYIKQKLKVTAAGDAYQQD